MSTDLSADRSFDLPLVLSADEGSGRTGFEVQDERAFVFFVALSNPFVVSLSNHPVLGKGRSKGNVLSLRADRSFDRLRTNGVRELRANGIRAHHERRT
jgi:hypothetical protein